MDNILLIIIVTIVVALILVGITIFVIRRNVNKKYKNRVMELDVEKNQLVNVQILSEITKVKNLVKTDNLQHKLNDWDGVFKYIKEDMIPNITDKISEVDFLIDKHDYKGAVRKMTLIELEIDRLKRKSGKLIDEIQLITQSEERNRSFITKLKVNYRELQSKFENNEKDYGELVKIIDNEFKKVEEMFSSFEEFMDNNDYVEVERIVIDIENAINYIRDILDSVPSILLMANVLIPGKIEETKLLYSRMMRDGYPMDYLNVEYNLDEIIKKKNVILENVRKLEFKDADIELKTIMD